MGLSSSPKLGMWAATLVNVNVIIGAGIFLNASPLCKMAGGWGFLAYPIGLLILMPVILTISEMTIMRPSVGGLYANARDFLHPAAGFLGGWSYFLGKAISSALLSHTFVMFFHRRFAFLQIFPVTLLDTIFIFGLAGMNIAGVRLGGKVQWVFALIRLLPIGFVIFCGIAALFMGVESTVAWGDMTGLMDTLPLAIFALGSFEVTATIAHMIEDPAHTARKIIVTSVMIVVTAYLFFQLSISYILGNSLASSVEPVLRVSNFLFPGVPRLGLFMNNVVFFSMISGAFGLLANNCWNLFALANDQWLPYKSALTKINVMDSPWVSLLVEAGFASAALAFTRRQIPLQSMAVLAAVVAYLLVSLAALRASKTSKHPLYVGIISLAAVGSCVYIGWKCLERIMSVGLSVSFLFLFSIGIIAAIANKFVKGRRGPFFNAMH
ncbi:hypothetical protein HOD08_04250 [bacterium]|nr:hypothetical protein [bacterium]